MFTWVYNSVLFAFVWLHFVIVAMGEHLIAGTITETWRMYCICCSCCASLGIKAVRNASWVKAKVQM